MAYLTGRLVWSVLGELNAAMGSLTVGKSANSLALRPSSAEFG